MSIELFRCKFSDIWGTFCFYWRDSKQSSGRNSRSVPAYRVLFLNSLFCPFIHADFRSVTRYRPLLPTFRLPSHTKTPFRIAALPHDVRRNEKASKRRWATSLRGQLAHCWPVTWRLVFSDVLQTARGVAALEWVTSSPREQTATTSFHHSPVWKSLTLEGRRQGHRDWGQHESRSRRAIQAETNFIVQWRTMISMTIIGAVGGLFCSVAFERVASTPRSWSLLSTPLCQPKKHGKHIPTTQRLYINNTEPCINNNNNNNKKKLSIDYDIYFRMYLWWSLYTLHLLAYQVTQVSVVEFVWRLSSTN